MKKKTLLALSASLLLGVGAATAQTTTYSAYTGTQTLTSYGTRMLEDYDVAIHLAVSDQDNGLVGGKITGVRIPFPDDIAHISNAKAWISTSLALQDAAFEPNVEAKAFTAGPGFIDVTFDTPYTLTDEGVYVGYSFSMDEKVSKPVTTVSGTNPDFFYLHTGRSYWEEFGSVSADRGMMLAMQVLVDGLPARAVSPQLEEGYFQSGAGGNTVTVQLRNQGSQTVSAVDVSYILDGDESSRTTRHIDLSTPLPPYYNAAEAVSVPVGTLTHVGDYRFSLTVDKVDAEANAAALPNCETTLHGLSFVPQKRALLEEYTGTWCGWCPKGFVGLENMDALLGDDFVGVSYHNRDPMEFAGTDEGPAFPNGTASFPSAFIDRYHPTDPYSGDEPTTHFLLDKTYAAACQEMAPANISLTAKRSASQPNQVTCQATVRFPLPLADNTYQLGFILTADGLHGETDDWTQKNYYPNNTEYSDADMELFTQNSGYVYDLVYNFVAIGFSSPSFIAESLPAQIEADKDYQYTFTFDLSQDSETCKAHSILADQTDYQLRAVALLVDSATGQVANACKVHVDGGGTSAVVSAQAQADAAPVAYYSIDGRRLQQPQQGVNIVRRADGSTVKVVRK